MRPLFMSLILIKNNKNENKKAGVRNKVLMVLGLCMLMAQVPKVFAEQDEEKYILSIPSQPIAEAIKTLSYQTEHSVLFRTDVLGEEYTELLKGEYSLQQALDSLLENTRLKGGLTESEVIVISLKTDSKSSALEETTLMNNEIKNSLVAGAVAIAIIGGTPIYGQEKAPDTSGETRLVETADGQIIEEMTVTGRRLDINLAIDAKRNAKRIIDTITADESSRLPDNNIIESLSRIPGVSFRRDANTGEGISISVRGLDSALNNVQFDGVNGAASAENGTRSVGLEGISADDIAELRVAKSLLPEDEGEGIGSSVKIISKSALERGEDSIRFDLEGRTYDFNDKDGFRAKAGFTKIFSDDFGVNLSTSFRRREIRNFRINGSRPRPFRFTQFTRLNGEVLSTADLIALNNAQNAADAAAGDTTPDDDLFDVGTVFNDSLAGQFPLTDLGFTRNTYSVTEQTRDSFNLSGTADWRITPNTLLTLGGRYSDEERIQDQNKLDFEANDEDFRVTPDGQLLTDYSNSITSFRLETSDRNRTNGSFYLRGQTELDRLNLDYRASFSFEENDSPDSEIEFRQIDRIRDIFRSRQSFRDDTGAPIVSGDQHFAPYTYVNTYFPRPNLGVLTIPGFVDLETGEFNPSMRDLLGDVNNSYKNQFLDIQQVDDNRNERVALSLDGEYDLGFDAFGGTFNSVKFGAKIERSGTDTNSSRVGIGDGRFERDGSFNPVNNDLNNDILFGDFEGIRTDEIISLADIGNPLDGYPLAGIPRVDGDGWRSFVRNFNNTLNGQRPPSSFTRRAVEEDISALYAQTEFETDRLSIIGGVRVEHYTGEYITAQLLDTARLTLDNRDIGGVRTRIPFFNGSLRDTQAVFTENNTDTQILPRINATYELKDDLLLRGGFGYSLARPSLRQLSRTGEIDFDMTVEDAPTLLGATSIADIVAAGGLPLDRIRVSSSTDFDIERGNPNLEPARSRNIDLSLEWYPREGTSLSAGLFHKEIKNFIFINSEPDVTAANLSITEVANLLTPDAMALFEPFGGLEGFLTGPDTTDLIDVDLRQPENGDTATVRGIELGVNHQFDWAPSIFADMGFSGNITFTDSDAELPAGRYDSNTDLNVYLGEAEFLEDLPARQVSFFNSPPVTANALLYYDANGLDIGLSYSYQDHSFDELDQYGVSKFEEEYYQFDFSASYELPQKYFGGEFKVYFEVPDFTDSGDKPTAVQTIGEGSSLVDLAAFNGREYRFGIRGKF